MAIDPNHGDPPNRETVIVERTGSGGLVLMVLALALLAGVALFIYSQATHSDMARNNAITHAVNQAGNAAQDVGDAAKRQ